MNKVIRLLLVSSLLFLPLMSFAVDSCIGKHNVKSFGDRKVTRLQITMVNRTAKRNPPGVKIDVRLRYVSRALGIGPKHHKVFCQTNGISPKKGKNSIIAVIDYDEGGETAYEPQFRESGHKTWYSCPDQLKPVYRKTISKLVQFWEFSNNRHVACSMH